MAATQSGDGGHGDKAVQERASTPTPLGTVARAQSPTPSLTASPTPIPTPTPSPTEAPAAAATSPPVAQPTVVEPPAPPPSACEAGLILVWGSVCLPQGYGDYPTWAVDQVSNWFFGLVGLTPTAEDIAANSQNCSAAPDAPRYWRVTCADTGGEYLVNHDDGSVSTANAAADAAVLWWIILHSPPSAPTGTTLVAQDGQYLGIVTCNEFETDGIFNRFGSYGSRFSSTSIWNRFGSYGGQFGPYSPFNSFAQPPEILDDGTLVAYLTVSSIWIPSITPEDLVLACFSSDPTDLEYWLGLVADSS